MREDYVTVEYGLADGLAKPISFEEARVKQPLPEGRGILMYVRMDPAFVKNRKVIHIRFAWQLGLEHFLVKETWVAMRAFRVTHVHFLRLPNTEPSRSWEIISTLNSCLHPPELRSNLGSPWLEDPPILAKDRAVS